MANYKVQRDVVWRIIQEDPWAILKPAYLSFRYEEETGEELNPSSLDYIRKQNGLQWAKESPDYTDGIERCWDAERGKEKIWGRGKRASK